MDARINFLAAQAGQRPDGRAEVGSHLAPSPEEVKPVGTGIVGEDCLPEDIFSHCPYLAFILLRPSLDVQCLNDGSLVKLILICIPHTAQGDDCQLITG
jgi:hypothetical protein